MRRYVDSLIVLLEAIDSLPLKVWRNFSNPFIDDFVNALPWQHGETLFNAVLDVGT